MKIPSHQVTMGDIVMLEAGDYVPADGRILENASLKVDESALTGESLGVEKTEEPIEGRFLWETGPTWYSLEALYPMAVVPSW